MGRGCPVSSSPAASAFSRIKGKYPRPVSQACIHAACLVHRAQLLYTFCPGFSLAKSDFPLSLLCSPVTAHSHHQVQTQVTLHLTFFDDVSSSDSMESKIPKQRSQLTEVRTQTVQTFVGLKPFAAHS